MKPNELSKAIKETPKLQPALSQEILSNLVLNGDLSKLTPIGKMTYYNALCNRIGIDPVTQPFKLLRLNGKEVLYADKGCTQQLSKLYNISHEIVKKEKIEDVYVVTVRAKNSEGRFTDEDGAVTIGTLKGDALANLLMKAITKAKRRAVLALCGLGMLDESEIETIPNAEEIPLPTPTIAQNKPEIAQIQTNAPKSIDDTPDRTIEQIQLDSELYGKIEKELQEASTLTELKKVLNTRFAQISKMPQENQDQLKELFEDRKRMLMIK